LKCAAYCVLKLRVLSIPQAQLQTVELRPITHELPSGMIARFGYIFITWKDKSAPNDEPAPTTRIPNAADLQAWKLNLNQDPEQEP